MAAEYELDAWYRLGSGRMKKKTMLIRAVALAPIMRFLWTYMSSPLPRPKPLPDAVSVPSAAPPEDIEIFGYFPVSNHARLNTHNHLIKQTFVIVSCLLALSANCKNSADANPEQKARIPRKIQLGVARSNLSRISPDKQQKILTGIAALGADWVRDGYNLEVFQRAREQHLKILEIIGPRQTDFDPSYRSENAGQEFCKRCGWTQGSSKLSRVNTAKMASRLRDEFDALKAANIEVDAFEIGNEYDWVCFNGDAPEGVLPTENQFKNAVRAYAHILRTAAEIIREPKYFPHAKIITFGICHSADPKHSFDGDQFVAMLKNLDGFNYLDNEHYHVDGIGTHIYCSPDYVAGTLNERLRNDAKVIGKGKPFWITECGVGDASKYPSKKGQTFQRAVQEFYNTLDERGDVPVAAVFYYPYEALANAPGQFTPAGTVLNTRAKLVFEKDFTTNGDSTKSNSEWNEFFHLPKRLLDANSSYKIHFDYKELDAGKNTGFYALVRSASNPKKTTSWHDLPINIGQAGSLDFSVSAKDVDDYSLIIGIHNQGKIAIEDIRVTRELTVKE
jgi:hypothetical protein